VSLMRRRKWPWTPVCPARNYVQKYVEARRGIRFRTCPPLFVGCKFRVFVAHCCLGVSHEAYCVTLCRCRFVRASRLTGGLCLCGRYAGQGAGSGGNGV
jgi:hypothetical protein